jgi:TorA maturation chaperone TorD
MLSATSESPLPTPARPGLPESPADEQLLRAGAYGLLAALLRSPPDASLLGQLRAYDLPEQRGEDNVATALRLLGLAARDANPEAVSDEFHALFVGLGRGELVPYGSWYLTGFLMEQPLSRLRDDLVALGFERQPDVHEPEDHVAALCEVMTMLIQEGAAHATQQAFFDQHLAPWLGRFFADLEAAQSACLYRAVARFGSAYTELESRYFGMQL